MKPDWKDAPKWAKYLAMDDRYIWYWMEYKPCYMGTCWVGQGRRIQIGRGGGAGGSWRNSVERRP